MRFIVCVKQVPDTTEVEVDPETGTIIREGVPSVLNAFDEFALNVAVHLKESSSEEIEIVALSMGPPQAKDALTKCLAIGADKAVLLTDRVFAGADTWATAVTLARAIKKLGGADLIFTGQEASDGNTAQVGPEVAAHLGIPQLTFVSEIESLEDKKLICKKETDEGFIRVRCPLPLMIACMPTPGFQPKIPNMRDIIKGKRKPYSEWNYEDLGGEKSDYGLEGSESVVMKTYSPPPKGEGIIVDDEPEMAVKKLIAYMKEEGIL